MNPPCIKVHVGFSTHAYSVGGMDVSKVAGQSFCTAIVKGASLTESSSMDTYEHKGHTSHPHHAMLKEASEGVSRRRERRGQKNKIKGPRPGPNGGNSAEVKPSFCSSRIKEAFERQRAFLFCGGPSKLQAMLVLGCVV